MNLFHSNKEAIQYLKVQYVKIGHPSNSYKEKKGGIISIEKPLTAAK